MKDCCKNEDNIVIMVVNNIPVYKCKICGRKHYMINAETGNIGIKVAGL